MNSQIATDLALKAKELIKQENIDSDQLRKTIEELADTLLLAVETITNMYFENGGS
jgi:hypothetical protein